MRPLFTRACALRGRRDALHRQAAWPCCRWRHSGSTRVAQALVALQADVLPLESHVLDPLSLPQTWHSALRLGERQHDAAAPVSGTDMASGISSGSPGLDAPCAKVPTTPPAYTRALHPPRTTHAGHGTSPEIRSNHRRTKQATRRLNGVRRSCALPPSMSPAPE